MEDDGLARLAAHLDELELRVRQIAERDGLRELELRSLQREVALRAEYLSELERIPEEVIAPKDVHIRNLEAIIAQLQEELSSRAGPVGRWRRVVFKALFRPRGPGGGAQKGRLGD